MRKRAVFCGTVGGRIADTIMPLSSSSALALSAIADEPKIIGCIGVTELDIGRSICFAYFRNRFTNNRNFSLRQDSSCTNRKLARAASAREGGSAVV